MNTVTIKNVTVSSTPLLQVTTGGRPYTKFDVDMESVNRELNIPVTVTVHVKTWGDIAENVERFVNKSQVLTIKGKFETSDYTDKNGNPRKWTEFVAFEISRGHAVLGQEGFAVPAEPEEVGSGEITPVFEEAKD